MRRTGPKPYDYHKSDADGVGFDRSGSGSNAAEQYANPAEKLFGSIDTCPEELLLWFHHVSWVHPMTSGRTLWDELGVRYQQGIDAVRLMRRQWDTLEGKVDEPRFTQVQQLLKIQEKEAIWWKDACMLSFQTCSNQPWPSELEAAENTIGILPIAEISLCSRDQAQVVKTRSRCI